MNLDTIEKIITSALCEYSLIQVEHSSSNDKYHEFDVLFDHNAGIARLEFGKRFNILTIKDYKGDYVKIDADSVNYDVLFLEDIYHSIMAISSEKSRLNFISFVKRNDFQLTKINHD